MDTYGHLWTNKDTHRHIRHIWTLMDTYVHIKTHIDTYGH